MRDADYAAALSEYIRLLQKEKLSKSDKKRKKELADLWRINAAVCL